MVQLIRDDQSSLARPRAAVAVLAVTLAVVVVWGLGAPSVVQTKRAVPSDHSPPADGGVNDILAQRSSALSRTDTLPRATQQCEVKVRDPGATHEESVRRISDGSALGFAVTDTFSCVVDRGLLVDGLAAPQERIDLGNAANTLRPMSAARLTEEALRPTTRRSATTAPLLVVDVCLSMYHTFNDLLPALVGLYERDRSAAHHAPPFQLVFRSACHVFHLSSLLMLLPFAVTEALPLDGASYDDDAFTRMLEGKVFVTTSPEGVQLRLADADFESPARRRVVLNHDDSVCGCGAVVTGESLPSPDPGLGHVMRVLGDGLRTALPVPLDAMDTLWSSCPKDAYRVIFMRRRNSRLLGNPQDVLHALRSQKYLCAKPFYFDELPVLMQYFAVRSAHAIVGQHGAGLTYLTMMTGRPAHDGAAEDKSCSRALVELWFAGKHSRSLGVYEKYAGLGGLGYRLLLPASVEFYHFKPGESGVFANKTNGTAPETMEMPPGIELEPGGRSAMKHLRKLKKQSSPHFNPYFLQQIASFEPAHLRAVAEWLAAHLVDKCPM